MRRVESKYDDPLTVRDWINNFNKKNVNVESVSIIERNSMIFAVVIYDDDTTEPR